MIMIEVVSSFKRHLFLKDQVSICFSGALAETRAKVNVKWSSKYVH